MARRPGHLDVHRWWEADGAPPRASGRPPLVKGGIEPSQSGRRRHRASDAYLHMICTTHVQLFAGPQGSALILRHGGTVVRRGGRRRVGASGVAEPLPLWLRGATPLYPRAGSSTYDMVLDDDGYGVLSVWHSRAPAPAYRPLYRRVARALGSTCSVVYWYRQARLAVWFRACIA